MLVLEQLKQKYLLYEDFWDEWKYYEHNGLNDADVYTIERYRESNFVVQTRYLELFVDRDEIIHVLTGKLEEKLQRNYQDYQYWVVLRFWLYFFNLALKMGRQPVCQIPINNLCLEHELSEKLKLFRCTTIGDIFDTCRLPVLNNEKMFNQVLQFKKCI